MAFSSPGFKCSSEFVIFYGFAMGLRRSSDYSACRTWKLTRGDQKALIVDSLGIQKRLFYTTQWHVLHSRYSLSGCHLCQCMQNNSGDVNNTPVETCATFKWSSLLTLHNLLSASSCIHSMPAKLITTEKLIFHNKKSAKIKQRCDALFMFSARMMFWEITFRKHLSDHD